MGETSGKYERAIFERKGHKSIEHQKKSVCFGCSWVGQPSLVEPTTQPVPDSTNRLAQQMEPEKHEGNTRTYHILPERSRKTSNRPCTYRNTIAGSLANIQFPQLNTWSQLPRPPAVPKGTAKQNCTHKRKRR